VPVQDADRARIDVIDDAVPGRSAPKLTDQPEAAEHGPYCRHGPTWLSRGFTPHRRESGCVSPVPRCRSRYCNDAQVASRKRAPLCNSCASRKIAVKKGGEIRSTASLSVFRKTVLCRRDKAPLRLVNSSSRRAEAWHYPFGRSPQVFQTRVGTGDFVRY